jgi:hypothetical protein
MTNNALQFLADSLDRLTLLERLHEDPQVQPSSPTT